MHRESQKPIHYCIVKRDSGSAVSFFFLSSRRRHTRCSRDWSSDVCSSDLMLDLTFASFAYLRLPLLVASLAFLAGAIGTFRWRGERSFLAAAVMMIIFFHAARLALVVFDPFLSSRPLAEAIRRAPEGTLINNRNYYEFSSITFYTNQDALILNGRYFNLEYGSYAPGAPKLFIDDAEFKPRWREPQR